MRFKTAGLVIIIVLAVLVLGIAWQINETQRISADITQFGAQKTIQASSVENENIMLSVQDNTDQVNVGDKITYSVFYMAKKDLNNVRIVGSLGNTDAKVAPTLEWNLGNIKAGTSASFNVPITIQKGATNQVISRVTISKIGQPTWWGKEKREVLATVDDVTQVGSQ